MLTEPNSLPLLQRLLALPALLVLAWPAGQAVGADAGATPPARPEVMSRMELRQCMDHQDALARRRAILDAEQKLSDSEAAALAEEARLLSAQMRTLDTGNSQKLAAYNRQLAGHNESVERYNAALELLANETTQLNADTADMMSSCTTRLFNKDDQEAILAERRSGGAAPAPNP